MAHQYRPAERHGRDLMQCDMQVRDPSTNEYRPCKSPGQHIVEDRWGEVWTLCKKHYNLHIAEYWKV